MFNITRTCSCILLPELEPPEGASPHFFWLLLLPPAVLLSCSVHLLAVADVYFVTAFDESLPGAVPFENIKLQSSIVSKPIFVLYVR